MTISRKIGLHICNSTTLALGRPRVVKMLDPSVDYYRQVRGEVGADCLIVVRFYHKEQPVDNPVQNAYDWLNAHRSWIEAVPATERVVYEGWNEIGDDKAGYYARFELARMTLLHAIGRHACIGNWSVGCPDLPVWTTYRPVLLEMRDGDVVGLHEYWSDRADIDNVWHVRRFTIPTVAANLAGKRIVITECGRDIVEGHGQPGWQHTTNAEGYLDDLRHAGELYDACDNVDGAVVYQTGSLDTDKWGPFDARPVWPALVQQYAPQTAPVAPPVVTPPAPAPIVLLPPVHEYVRISQLFIPGQHYGIDFSEYEGTLVYASIDGVAYRGDQGTAGFGKYVRIEDGNGLYVYTAHMSSFAVGDMDEVQAGDIIGLSGNTGNSTGPHVHFEVRKGSRLQASAIDPWPYIVWPPDPEPEPPAPEPLPSDEQGPPAVLAQKARWWEQEQQRQVEAGKHERATAIRLSQIKLLERLERELQ